MSPRTKAVLALAGATFAWSFPLIFVKYLSAYLDGWTQNAYRYFFAMVFLLVWIRRRRGGFGISSGKQFAAFIIPAIPCVIFQSFFVFSMYFKEFYPGQGAILQKTIAIFGALFGFIFFPEERRHILSFLYLGGLAAAVLGSVGIVLSDPNRSREVYYLGAIFAVAATAFWGLYSVSMKKLMRGVHPVPAFGLVSVWLTVFFFALSVGMGSPGDILHVPLRVLLAVVGSGIVCIGLGHTLFFYSVRELGVAVPAAVQLVTGITTPLFSFFIYGETLTGVQMIWGAVLIVGAFATLRSGMVPGPD